jgi:hypothetical protein
MINIVPVENGLCIFSEKIIYIKAKEISVKISAMIIKN